MFSFSAYNDLQAQLALFTHLKVHLITLMVPINQVEKRHTDIKYPFGFVNR